MNFKVSREIHMSQGGLNIKNASKFESVQFNSTKIPLNVELKFLFNYLILTFIKVRICCSDSASH